MRILVESLKRLYIKGSVTIEKLNDMVIADKITEEEKNYIIK